MSVENKTLTVATWSAEKGGNEKYNFPEKLSQTPEHYQEILQGIEALKKNGAEIIVLTDTHGWPKQVFDEKLKKDTGSSFARTIALEDERFQEKGTPDTAISVISDLDVIEQQIIRLANRNALRITVLINGKPVDVYGVYLDDTREKLRIMQTHDLVQDTRSRNNARVILGDLNCTADENPTIRERALIAAFDTVPHLMLRLRLVARKFLPLPHYNINVPGNAYDTGFAKNIVANFSRRAINRTQTLMEKFHNHGPIKYLESEGFKHAVDERHRDTMPSPKLFRFPFINVDHVLASGDITITSTGVPHDEVFSVSDHFPRVASLDL